MKGDKFFPYYEYNRWSLQYLLSSATSTHLESVLFWRIFLFSYKLYKLMLISWSRPHSHYSPLIIAYVWKVLIRISLKPFIVNAYLCEFFLRKNISKIRKKNAIKHNNTWRFLSVKKHFLLMPLNIFERHVL